MDGENPALAIGDMLHGACMTIFGNQHYGCAQVEATGTDWVVARPISRNHRGERQNTRPVLVTGPYVLADARINRDLGPQDGCLDSSETGCAYRIEYDQDF